MTHRSEVESAIVFDDAFVRRLERLALVVARVTGAVGSRIGARRTPAADFVDHRAYSPGDDMRHIDWPLAARHDDVFVKVGRTHNAAALTLLVDVSASMAVTPAKWRRALEITAALGWLSLAHGDRVMVAPFPEGATWGPASGAGVTGALLAAMAALKPAATDDTPVEPMMERLVRAAPLGGLLVLVSDLWVADDLDRALRLVAPPRWETVVLHVLDRTELDPQVDGLVELVDSESGESLGIDRDAEVVAAYRQVINERCERLESLLARSGASYALIPADGDLERSVIPLLQRRRLLA